MRTSAIQKCRKRQISEKYPVTEPPCSTRRLGTAGYDLSQSQTKRYAPSWATEYIREFWGESMAEFPGKSAQNRAARVLVSVHSPR